MSQPSAVSAYPTVTKWNVVFTSGCNLRCGYCATNYGTFGKPDGVMDDKTATRLADWIAGSLKPGKQPTRIIFSGGETFLHYDRFLALADQIMGRCKENGGTAKISVTTNGVLLNPDRLRQLAEHGIALAFSIDGPEQIHDAMRRNGSGRGSFAAAFRNYQSFRDLGLAGNPPTYYSVHSVFGPHSGSVRTICEFWIRQNMPMVDLAIVSHSQFEKPADREAVDRAQAAAVEGLREWALDQAERCTPENFLERYQGPTVIYKGWHHLLFGVKHPLCTPGRGILAVSHDGNLYPCEACIGADRWRIGNLGDGIDAERLAAFLGECRKAENICAACPIEPACDKPCLAIFPAGTPAENIAAECNISKHVTGLLQESFDRLMQKKGRPHPNE